jgi:hypothetical protein
MNPQQGTPPMSLPPPLPAGYPGSYDTTKAPYTVIPDDNPNAGQCVNQGRDCVMAPITEGQKLANICAAICMEMGIPVTQWDKLTEDCRQMLERTANDYSLPFRQNVEHWEIEARHAVKNNEFHRGMLIQIARDCAGPGIYLADDFSFQDQPLLAKLPDIMEKSYNHYLRVMVALRSLGVHLLNYVRLDAGELAIDGRVDADRVVAVTVAALESQKRGLERLREHRGKLSTEVDQLYAKTHFLENELRDKEGKLSHARSELSTERQALMMMLAQEHDIITPEVPPNVEIPLRVLTAIGFFSQFIRARGMAGTPWAMDIFFDRDTAEGWERQLQAVSRVLANIDDGKYLMSHEHMLAAVTGLRDTSLQQFQTINQMCRALTGLGQQEPNGWSHEKAVDLAIQKAKHNNDLFTAYESLRTVWDAVRVRLTGHDTMPDESLKSAIFALCDRSANQQEQISDLESHVKSLEAHREADRNSLIGAQNVINMTGRALTGHPILDDSGPTFGREEVIRLAEDANKRHADLTQRAAKWETLALQLAQVWWWCHEHNANLQHGDLSSPEVTFSICLLGQEWQNGTCVFHAPTPLEAQEKAHAYMLENPQAFASFVQGHMTPADAVFGFGAYLTCRRNISHPDERECTDPKNCTCPQQEGQVAYSCPEHGGPAPVCNCSMQMMPSALQWQHDVSCPAYFPMVGTGG